MYKYEGLLSKGKNNNFEKNIRLIEYKLLLDWTDIEKTDEKEREKIEKINTIEGMDKYFRENLNINKLAVVRIGMLHDITDNLYVSNLLLNAFYYGNENTKGYSVYCKGDIEKFKNLDELSDKIQLPLRHIACNFYINKQGNIYHIYDEDIIK